MLDFFSSGEISSVEVDARKAADLGAGEQMLGCF
jgi:hypothetical protein